MKLIKGENFIDSKWAGGVTSEIFIYPENAKVSEKNFDFRISTATCNLEKSNYTAYDGFLRYICPLDNTMNITTSDCKFSLKPMEVMFFHGNDNTYSSGDVRDFNLIYREDLKAQMYSLNIKDLKYKFKGKSIIFNYDSLLTYNEKIFPKFSALYIEDEEVEIKGCGKIIICQIL